MDDDEKRTSGIGVALIAWVAVFIMSWMLISAYTKQEGLALVWGVFIALAAFQLTLSSFRAGIALISLSLFLILLKAAYSLFV